MRGPIPPVAPGLPPLDRRAILVALAKRELLTQDLAYRVRVLPETDVRAFLLKEAFPPEILLAAGLPVLRSPAPGTFLPDSAVETEVSLHLMLLQLPDAPLFWTSHAVGLHTPLAHVWERQLPPPSHVALTHGLPLRLARLVSMHHLDFWRPLTRLLEHRVYPYGPSEDFSRFYLTRDDLEMALAPKQPDPDTMRHPPPPIPTFILEKLGAHDAGSPATPPAPPTQPPRPERA